MARARKNRSSNARGRWMLATRMAAWTAVLALLGTAAYLGGRSLWSAISRDKHFEVNWSQDVVWPEFPAWVDAAAMEGELSEHLLGHLPRKGDGEKEDKPDRVPIFQREGADARSAAVMAYEALWDKDEKGPRFPWFAELSAVKKELPGRLRVHARFRRPAGVALWRDEPKLVDVEGRYLPADLFRRPEDWAETRIPEILDKNLRDRPRRGQKWDHPRMAAGARLNEYLLQKGLFSRLEIARIDVTWVGRGAENMLDGEGNTLAEITLVAASGARIKWGKSSVYNQVEGLAFPPTEYPDDDKLQRLLTAVEKHPGLAGLEHVDLRFKPTTFRPVAEAGAP